MKKRAMSVILTTAMLAGIAAAAMPVMAQEEGKIF